VPRRGTRASGAASKQSALQLVVRPVVPFCRRILQIEDHKPMLT
jgi:hypothetical protein